MDAGRGEKRERVEREREEENKQCDKENKEQAGYFVSDFMLENKAGIKS